MRWRLVMWQSGRTFRLAGLAALSVALVIGAAVFLLPAVVRAMVQAFGLLLRGTIWVATAAGRGDDAWTIAGAVGQGIMSALLTPGALGIVGGLLVMGAAAVFGLQRLLDSEDEEESLR